MSMMMMSSMMSSMSSRSFVGCSTSHEARIGQIRLRRNTSTTTRATTTTSCGRRQRPLWKRTTCCALAATAAAALTTAPGSFGVGVVKAFPTATFRHYSSTRKSHNRNSDLALSLSAPTATAFSSTTTTPTSSSSSSLLTTTAPPSGAFVDLQHSEFSNHLDHSKPPVVFLHGLLGNRRNFATIGRSLAAQLEQPRRIVAVDLRNHGDTAIKQQQQQSTNTAAATAVDPTIQSMAYRHMAADVVAFLNAQEMESAVLVGHSVGGKLAQAVSLLHPDRVDGLVVLDIAPVAYTTQDAHWKAVVDILHVLKDIPPHSTKDSAPLTKRQVEVLLQPTISDPALRAFLLTNWNAKTGNWNIPVADICAQLDQLADFDIPAGASSDDDDEPSASDVGYQYPGDCFLIHGGQSRFVRHSYMTTIAQYFPNHLLTTVKSAGHWVHAEAPQDTTALLKRFLDR